MITLEEKKKVAVEMWYHIIDRIEREYEDNYRALHTYKMEYIGRIADKELFDCVNSWRSLCLFCDTYCYECKKCPLKSCNLDGNGSLWDTVVNGDTDTAVDAAYQIIKAIENWEGPENDRG